MLPYAEMKNIQGVSFGHARIYSNQTLLPKPSFAMDRCIFSGSPRLRGDTGIRACWHESFEPRCGHPPIEGGFILRLGAGFSFLFLAKKAIDFSTTHRTSVRRRQSCVFLPRFEGNKKPPATARGFSVSDEFAVRKRARLAVLHDDGAHGIGSLLASICCVLEALGTAYPTQTHTTGFPHHASTAHTEYGRTARRPLPQPIPHR